MYASPALFMRRSYTQRSKCKYQSVEEEEKRTMESNSQMSLGKRGRFVDLIKARQEYEEEKVPQDEIG